jgi:predicted Zn-dependent protease
MIAARVSKALGGLAAASLIALVSACSSFGPGVNVSHTEGQNVPFAQSDDPEEDAIGAREHPRILASYGGIYSDKPAEIMLARIVGRLLAAADQPNQKFTVTILDTAEVNAFALPGGYVYVTRGLLALASDTSEIAAVLAHEIAHAPTSSARARSSTRWCQASSAPISTPTRPPTATRCSSPPSRRRRNWPPTRKAS